MATGTALVIIDMQNEFMTGAGILERPVDGAALMGPIAIVCTAARAAGHEIVWVRSEYPERAERPPPLRPQRPSEPRFAGVPMNSDMLASGHAGPPCCRPGSPRAELIDPAAALVEPQDLQVVKSRYSAFADTELAAQLRARGVTEIVLCGVVANIAVRASAADGFFSGLEVIAVHDCIGASSARNLRDGLAAIARFYGEVLTCAEVLSRWRATRSGLGSGDSGAVYGILPPDLSQSALQRVREEVVWHEMRHRGGPVPRQIAIQGTVIDGVEPVYRHPADEQPPLVPWTPAVDALRRITEDRLGQTLNHALIQRYLGGESYISPHADKTLDVERGTTIVNLSLGATRTMILQSKDKSADGTYRSQRVELPHGSLFLLGWESNRMFRHGIRRDRRADIEKRADETRHDGERISLTFRSIATYRDSRGQLFGQGARRKSPGARAQDRAARDGSGDSEMAERREAERMLEAFGLENRQSDFDWDGCYGEGFDVLNFKILRGQPEE